MNRMKYILVLGLAAVAFGCPARSLFPLFAVKDLMTLPGGVGTWVSTKGDTVTIQSTEGKYYRLTLRTANRETGQYIGKVGKLGNSWFLDSYPAHKVADDHFIPAHYISKIRIEGDTLWTSALEGDWLEKMTGAGEFQIPYVKPDNDIILTASTQELQQLLLRYADDPGAFPKPEAFARMK